MTEDTPLIAFPLSPFSSSGLNFLCWLAEGAPGLSVQSDVCSQGVLLACSLCPKVSWAPCSSAPVCSHLPGAAFLGPCPASLSGCRFLPGCWLPESIWQVCCNAGGPGPEPGLQRHRCPPPVRSCHLLCGIPGPEESDTSSKVNL